MICALPAVYELRSYPRKPPKGRGKAEFQAILKLAAVQEDSVMDTLIAETPAGDVPGVAAEPSSVPAGWSWFVAAVLAAFYLAASLYISSHRLLWFDEVFTVHMARLPNWKTLIVALGHGVDSLPPPYYMVVGSFGKIFGHSELAVRLPSTLAMVATLLVVFDCARRLTDGLHGLIALALASGPLAGEGFEARSYAIYIMLAALALWVWVKGEQTGKKSALLFGTVLCLAVCFHYYAALLLVPFILYELLSWKPWQRPSTRLMAGAIGIVLPAVLFSPLITSFSRQFSRGFWSRPSFSQLINVYSDIFEGGLLFLALIALWMVLVDRKPGTVAIPAMPSGEVVGWLFLAIPLAGFLAAEIKTNAFAVRYFLAIVPGVAVAFASCVWRQFRNVPLVSAGVFLLFASWGVAKEFHTVRHPDSVETPETRQILAMEDNLNSDGTRFLVFSDAFHFLEVQYYSKHPEQCVLLLPDDFDHQANSRRSTPDPYIHQRVELLLSQYFPLRIWRTDVLRANAQRAILIDPTPAALDSIKRAGLQVLKYAPKPVPVMYLKEASPAPAL
jgi:hypothetical protein